jgi:hypothetical protein
MKHYYFYSFWHSVYTVVDNWFWGQCTVYHLNCGLQVYPEAEERGRQGDGEEGRHQPRGSGRQVSNSYYSNDDFQMSSLYVLFYFVC